MQLDPSFHLDDLCSDFQELQPDSLEGCRCKRSALEHVATESVYQNIGCRVQENPELVGKKTMA